jgi:16S rRNA (adenine1518-N6/adenine1519-N6)-dimethyltransferase
VKPKYKKTPPKPRIEGIPLKKQFGQHFLRDQKIVDHMIDAVPLNEKSAVLEIGCGDGFLTQAIIEQPIEKIWVFEIDPDWADYVREKITDERLEIFQDNILDIDFNRLKSNAPWILLSNLPYQITFPIMHLLQKNRDLFQEGVVMIQEEVAQKLVKKSGRGYGFPSLFFQHYFELKLLDKIPPTAFYPPPKVFSRLLYFKPKKKIVEIPNEPDFWKFIKLCFAQPRRTLRNNLAMTHFDASLIDEKKLALRAQQMTMQDFLHIWNLFNQ